MKKFPLFWTNFSVFVIFVAFFYRGLNTDIFMLPVILIISTFNLRHSESVPDLLLYNILLLIFTTVGSGVSSWLFLKLINYDEIGVALSQLAIIVEFTYVSIITIIELVIKQLIIVRQHIV